MALENGMNPPQPTAEMVFFTSSLDGSRQGTWFRPPSDAGAPDRGGDFLRRAVDTLGYRKDAPAPASTRRSCEATKKLLEKLDAGLASRGLSR